MQFGYDLAQERRIIGLDTACDFLDEFARISPSSSRMGKRSSTEASVEGARSRGSAMVTSPV